MPAFSSDDIVTILVLGAGWTSQFLVPLFESEHLTYALTTTSGKIKESCVGIYDDSKIISFAFDPDSDDETQYGSLPTAETAIITFPLSGPDPPRKLIDTYNRTHAGTVQTQWIQLGSTGIYKEAKILDHTSEISPNPRSEAEDQVLQLGGTVLNLAGLWGGARLPWNWVPRIAQTKDKLREKTSLHLIHGEDVARACLAMHRRFTGGERWIVTDNHVYDWWDLVDGWAEDLQSGDGGGQGPDYKRWIAELMREEDVRVLPRDKSRLGRVLDSSKFWEVMSILPRRVLTRKLDSTR